MGVWIDIVNNCDEKKLFPLQWFQRKMEKVMFSAIKQIASKKKMLHPKNEPYTCIRTTTEKIELLDKHLVRKNVISSKMHILRTRTPKLKIKQFLHFITNFHNFALKTELIELNGGLNPF